MENPKTLLKNHKLHDWGGPAKSLSWKHYRGGYILGWEILMITWEALLLIIEEMSCRRCLAMEAARDLSSKTG